MTIPQGSLDINYKIQQILSSTINEKSWCLPVKIYLVWPSFYWASFANQEETCWPVMICSFSPKVLPTGVQTESYLLFLSSGKDLIWGAFVRWSVCCWKKEWENVEADWSTEQTEDDWTRAYCAHVLVLIPRYFQLIFKFALLGLYFALPP